MMKPFTLFLLLASSSCSLGFIVSSPRCYSDSQCHGGGTCGPVPNHFHWECHCRPDYTGNYCENRISQATQTHTQPTTTQAQTTRPVATTTPVVTTTPVTTTTSEATTTPVAITTQVATTRPVTTIISEAAIIPVATTTPVPTTTTIAATTELIMYTDTPHCAKYNIVFDIADTVISHNSLASVCSTSGNRSSPEAFVLNHCNLTIQNPKEWKEGHQVMAKCAAVPAYTPVIETFRDEFRPGTHRSGIFLECLPEPEGFKMVYQGCDSIPTIKHVPSDEAKLFYTVQ